MKTIRLFSIFTFFTISLLYFGYVSFAAESPAPASAANGPSEKSASVSGTSTGAMSISSPAPATFSATSTNQAATGTPHLSQSDANSATSTPVAPSVVSSATSPGEIKSGAVVKVNGIDIYVDRGTADGVEIGAEMDIYHTEPVTGLDGKVLDIMEVRTGTMKIREAKAKVSIGELKSGKSPERGDFVKYRAVVPEQMTRTGNGICPPGMLYDGGGYFVYTPLAIGVGGTTNEKQTETNAFCIDRFPTEAAMTWSEAVAACGFRGARLCSLNEDQKVCSSWEKPKPCVPYQNENRMCPLENTVYGFKTQYEWVSYPIDKNGEKVNDSGSCSCHGRNPLCSHCFYTDCRGAKKQFRCCQEPLKDK